MYIITSYGIISPCTPAKQRRQCRYHSVKSGDYKVSSRSYCVRLANLNSAVSAESALASALTRANFTSMTARQLAQLAHEEDEELGRQCAMWRGRARYGDREAFGIAHALEVEQRRRTRSSQMQGLPPEPVPARAWWRFWQAGDEQRPMTPS